MIGMFLGGGIGSLMMQRAGGAVEDVAPASLAPEVIATDYKAGVPTTAQTFDIGDAAADRVVIVTVFYRGATGTPACTVNSEAATMCGSVLGQGDRKFISFTHPVPTGTTASIVISGLGGAKAENVGFVGVVAATGGVAYFGSRGAPLVGERTALNRVEHPDHALVLHYATTSTSIRRPAFVRGAATTHLDPLVIERPYLGGYSRPEARQRSAPVEVDMDPLVGTSPNDQGLYSISFSGDNSNEATNTGVAPLEAHGAMPPYSGRVGRAATIDLRAGHWGIDGSGDAAPTYAVSGAPAGMTLSGHTLSGIPTTAGSYTTTVTVSRVDPDQEITFDVAITVAASGVEALDSAAISFAPASQATFTAAAGPVWTYSAEASVDAANRRGVLSIATTPRATYRLTARVQATITTATKPRLRVQAVNGDVGQTRASDNYNSYLAEANIANGDQIIEMIFTAAKSTTYIAVGTFSEFSGSTWSTDGIASDEYVISAARMELIEDAPGATGSTTTQFVRHNGVLFQLDKPRAVRRYLNGAYNVKNSLADPVRIVGALPIAAGERHGATINQGRYTADSTRERRQALDGRSTSSALIYADFMNYDPAFQGGPVVFSAEAQGRNGSFAKAVSSLNRNIFAGDTCHIAELHSLTVTTAAAPANAFQPSPSYIEQGHYTANFTSDILPAYALPSGETLPDYDELAWRVRGERQMLSGNTPNDPNILPRVQQAYYGRDQGDWDSAVFCALMLDPDQTGTLTTAQRNALLVQVVQVGLHLLGREATGARWIPEGGGSQNVKTFATLAGLLLDNAALTTWLDPDNSAWPEDVFVGTVAQTHIDNPPLDWDAGNTDRPRAPYEAYMIGRPEWWSQGPSARASGSNMTATYRDIANNVEVAATLLMHKTTGAKTAFGNDIFFDYKDFHVAQDWRASNTPIAPLVKAMWLAYRSEGAPVKANTYGLTWKDYLDVTDVTDPKAQAVDVPAMRDYPVGWQTTLDLAANEFNVVDAPLGGAKSRTGTDLAQGKPTAYAVSAIYAADGVTTSTDVAASVNSSGVLTLTPATTDLHFVDVTGTANSQSVTSRIAVQGRANPYSALDQFDAMRRANDSPLVGVFAEFQSVTLPSVFAEPGDHVLVFLTPNRPRDVSLPVLGGVSGAVAYSAPTVTPDRTTTRVLRFVAPVGGWSSDLTLTFTYAQPRSNTYLIGHMVVRGEYDVAGATWVHDGDTSADPSVNITAAAGDLVIAFGHHSWDASSANDVTFGGAAAALGTTVMQGIINTENRYAAWHAEIDSTVTAQALIAERTASTSAVRQIVAAIISPS